jgi:hypothetical protein
VAPRLLAATGSRGRDLEGPVNRDRLTLEAEEEAGGEVQTNSRPGGRQTAHRAGRSSPRENAGKKASGLAQGQDYDIADLAGGRPDPWARRHLSSIATVSKPFTA